MQTRFEHFATSSMLCATDAPPRQNGNFHFDRDWEPRAFGIALSLSRLGYFEWEDFRQNLIKAISDWEAAHPETSEGWDYYECWLLALERVVLDAGVLDAGDLAALMEPAAAS